MIPQGRFGTCYALECKDTIIFLLFAAVMSCCLFPLRTILYQLWQQITISFIMNESVVFLMT